LRSSVKEALPHYENAHRYLPESWGYTFSHARALIDDGQLSPGQDLLSGLVKSLYTSPDFGSAQCQGCLAATLEQLGRIYQETGQLKEAEQQYLQVVDIENKLATQHLDREQYYAESLRRLADLYKQDNS